MHPQIETPRAQILEIQGGIQSDPDSGLPMIEAAMRIEFEGDREIGLARELHRASLLGFLVRSGLSRVGVDARFRSRSDMEFSGNRADFMIQIASLRGAANDRLLSVLLKMVEERGPGNVDVGRMSLLDPGKALNGAQVHEAIQKGELMVTPETVIEEDGVINIPLADLHYIMCEPNLTDERMRRVISHGKHALGGVQDLARTPRPDIIKPGEFFVGGMHLSIGPFIGIIARHTNDHEVVHLAARGLDGIRTTGMKVPRQVELFNRGKEPKKLRDLRVRIRLHHANNTIGKLGRSVVNQRTHEGGVLFHDIMEVAKEPDLMLKLIKEVSERREGEGDYGLLIAGHKCARVPWMATPNFQRHGLEEFSEKFLGGEAEQFIHGPQIPPVVRPFTDVLKYVGGAQSEGKILVTHAFPDASTMQALMEHGVGIFEAQNLRQRDQAFDENPDDGAGELDLFFDSTLYEEFRRLAKRGARLYMAVPEIKIERASSVDTTPPHLREFDRGFWVRPEEKERVRKVNTIIAMYGSHRESLDEVLAAGIPNFMKQMKTLFDEHSGEGSLGITHGKGPGVMLLADRAAAKEGIVRFGVGIELEKLDGQSPNFSPEAIVDFNANDRLSRQKLMDDMATFKIFNIGGAGTLEEAAITMCSQKLMKNIFTPIIFVDPLNLGGVSANGDPTHLWNHLEQLIETLSGQGTFTDEQRQQGLNNLRLLRTYASKYCYFVNSYEKAGDVITAFVNDPKAHYTEWGIPEQHQKDARDNALQSANEREFPLPGFMSKIA